MKLKFVSKIDILSCPKLFKKSKEGSAKRGPRGQVKKCSSIILLLASHVSCHLALYQFSLALHNVLFVLLLMLSTWSFRFKKLSPPSKTETIRWKLKSFYLYSILLALPKLLLDSLVLVLKQPKFCIIFILVFLSWFPLLYSMLLCSIATYCNVKTRQGHLCNYLLFTHWALWSQLLVTGSNFDIFPKSTRWLWKNDLKFNSMQFSLAFTKLFL